MVASGSVMDGDSLLVNCEDLESHLIYSCKQLILQRITFVPASSPDKYLETLKAKYKPINITKKKRKKSKKAKMLPTTKQEDTDSASSPKDEEESIFSPKVTLFNKDELALTWNSVRGIGPGLVNLGNTCFLNSVIQCLTYTPPLANYLLSGEHKKKCHQSGSCALCQLQDHVIRVLGTSGGSVRPAPIIQHLKTLTKPFRIGRQEDAHEFLRYYVDSMQKSCLKGYPSKLDPHSKSTTLVHQLFGGYFRSQVKCLKCWNTSDTYDPLLDISVEAKNCPTLSKALKKITKPDMLDGDNKYSCPKCKTLTVAQKKFTLHSLPTVLTIQLKRFNYNNYYGTKISKHVSYPEYIDLRPFMSETQLLGPLPQFSQKNSASFKNNPLQFNDELDSLLNDDVQPDHHDTGRITGGFSGKSSILPAGPKLKSGTGKLGSVTRKTSSLKLSKPKSKLIPEAANESDNSLDVSVTEEDKAKIVGSIKNIDDMESNLFHSLNKTQPKIKSLGKSKKSNSSEALLQQQKQPRVTKKVSFEDEEFDEQEQELMREINKGLATSKSIKKTNSPPSLSKPQENATTATTTTKSATKSNLKRLDDDDDDDDLFADLLSDSEEEDEKGKHYQTKPKLKLIDSISKTQPASNDNNDNVNSGVTKSNSKEKAASQEGILMQRKQIPAEGAQDNDDEFDGDDILGLIDTPQKPTTGTKKASRFDELLGRKQPQEENQQPKKDEQSSPNTDNSNVASNTEHTIGTITMAKEDESSKTDFQFGGYLPSTISSNVSNRKSRGLPQGRGRKGLSDTVTSERPSTAPGKKSVRFSDALDSSGDALRPSSTPVVKGPTKQKEVNQHHPSPTANLEDVQTESKMSTIIPTGVMETSVTPQPNSAFGVTSDTLLVERPPTGNRRKRDVILPLDQQSLGLFESNESTTLLPSREHSAQSKPATPTASKPATPSASKPATPSAHQDVLHPEVFIKNETQSTATAPIMVSTATPALSNDVALQRQLTQQQLQMQQQSLQLQQLSSELATSKMQLEQAKCAGEKSATQVKEKLLQELDVTKNQLKELQVELQEERTTSSKLKVEVSALVNKLRLCENERATAVKQYEDIQQQNRQLSDEHRKEITSSTLAADDFKMKLHRTELERDQLQQTLQLCQQRHSEEIQSMEKSHSNRLATIEEAHQRREQRWKEEQEMETARHAERIQQLEQEKLNSAIAQRKKLESLEISKNNEIEKLQTVHRSSVGDLHREHELEIQHLKTLHDQEMAALKAAFSHTRALTDLTRQVEASSREVSSLQHRVDKAHSLGLTHREETLKCREEQLKANERRLAEQQAENEAERVRLQTLISRMESSLSDQTRQLEQERWKLQQDCVRLNAQQAAFDQDRASFTARIEQERADLQAAKEKFLAEQREIMSKCYEERRAVADEQSKLSSSQKMSKEKELRESERLVKAERTLKLQLERLEQESSRLAEERTKLLEEQETQESHHKVLAEQCKAITDREKEADGRLQQAIEMHEMATKMYQQGQRSLKEAQALKETAESQLANVRSQQAALQKQEKHLTQERLNFVKDKKEQIQETSNSAGTQATTDVVPDTIDTDDIILPSFDYAIQPQPPTRSHMGNLLDQLDTSIQLRRIAMEAEQDNEYLEEEKNFLASLCNSGRLTLMELESS